MFQEINTTGSFNVTMLPSHETNIKHITGTLFHFLTSDAVFLCFVFFCPPLYLLNRTVKIVKDKQKNTEGERRNKSSLTFVNQVIGIQECIWTEMFLIIEKVFKPFF